MRDNSHSIRQLVFFSRNPSLLNKSLLYQYSLAGLHRVCEASYVMLSELGVRQNHVFRQPLPEKGRLCIKMIESGRYTSLLELMISIPLSQDWALNFNASIRLYHDVKMVELTYLETEHDSIDAGRLYNNPVEKFHLNCLLYEWLTYGVRCGSGQ